MRDDKNKTDNTEKPDSNQAIDESGNEYAGFLVINASKGDRLKIGDSTLVINNVDRGKVKIAIQAKRHVLIRKMP